jgi:hypothetical protein
MNPGIELRNRVMDHLKDAFGPKAEDMFTLTTSGTHSSPVYVQANSLSTIAINTLQEEFEVSAVVVKNGEPAAMIHEPKH